MDERAFIAALRLLPLHQGARGLEDDAAVLDIGGETLVLTHDSLVEGRHWRPGQDMADVAWKLVAVNLSDLAAKGAEPVGILLGHTLGQDDERFIEGLREVTEEYRVPLLGGDTVASDGPRTLGLTAIGRATHIPVPVRCGAQPGDAVYVTGVLGGAMLGFEGDPAHIDALNRPHPLLREGQALAPHVTAMMDVSDGLLLDAFRMAQASMVTFDLESASFPVADPRRARECVTWGDDYQLLFTANADLHLPVPARRIGTVIAQDFAPLWVDRDIPDLDNLGYEHRSG